MVSAGRAQQRGLVEGSPRRVPQLARLEARSSIKSPKAAPSSPVSTEKFPPEIFGVVLHVQSSPTFRKVKPIVFPYLSAPEAKRSSRGQEKELRFPFVYRFSLPLRPRNPQPAELPCGILFNDHRGSTCKAGERWMGDGQAA